MERTKERKIIKIITNSGFKYLGELIEENSSFVILNDFKQGKIQVPLVNISFLQEVLKNDH